MTTWGRKYRSSNKRSYGFGTHVAGNEFARGSYHNAIYFASTTHAIVRNGLTPVFCDIDPDTYCMDASKIEKLITDRTCAIMPVHVYGNVCNIEEIECIAHKYELKVIYDAAHTFGETYKGKGIGSLVMHLVLASMQRRSLIVLKAGQFALAINSLGRSFMN